MKKLNKKLLVDAAIGISISIAIFITLYWKFERWDVALVVAIIPFHYFFRDTIGSFYSFRRDTEYQKDTKDAE